MTHRTTCTPKDGETRAGLWQWVISSEDYSVSAYTPHTVCRTGDLAFVEPSCSYWDCDDSQCSRCKQTNEEKATLKGTEVEVASKPDDDDDSDDGELVGVISF